MSEPLIRTEGFEEALAEAIAESFHFTDEALSSVDLVAGRHVFANRLPEASDVAKLTQSPAAFDPKVEPVIGIFGGEGSAARAPKHEFVIEFQLRAPGEGNRVSKLLGQLVDWLPRGMRGKRITGFIVKSAKVQSIPSAFQRIADNTYFARSRVRFLAVPTI